jgi:hypothetical protein
MGAFSKSQWLPVGNGNAKEGNSGLTGKPFLNATVYPILITQFKFLLDIIM